MPKMPKGFMEKQHERVLHSIFIVTVEDLRWLFRMERDLPDLVIEPHGIFKNVYMQFVDLFLKGIPMSPDIYTVLIDWMKIDAHWLLLFRQKIERGYPLMRLLQERVSNHFFGGELYKMWDPEGLLKEAYDLGPFNWGITPEYTLPYRYRKVDRCPMTDDERGILSFFGISDLETFIRASIIPGVTISYTKDFLGMQQNVRALDSDYSYSLDKDTARFLEACLRNDYIWWQILERELERVYLITTSLRFFGRRIYQLNDLGHVVDKLQQCVV